MAVDLTFLLDEPTLRFRAVKRKGELRYVASNRRGSLGAITRFAPPTKRIPKMLMGLFGLIDFRFPLVAKSIHISEEFLKQAATLLEIPVNLIGIYVGEPNDRQKLVVTDVEGKSQFVLKMAVGSEADVAIERERNALENFSHLGRKAHQEADFVNSVFSVRDIPLSAPQIQQVESVCGKSALLIERIPGKQLTPEEFNKTFFEKKSDFRQQVLGIRNDEGEGSHKGTEHRDYVSVGTWLDHSLKLNTSNLNPLIDSCHESGALDLLSPLGVVHGDFAPWNAIRRQADENLKLNHLKLKTGDSLRLCLIDWEFSRPGTPLVFDIAYAAWCYEELLGRTVSSVEPELWKKLVALGALWRKIRSQ